MAMLPALLSAGENAIRKTGTSTLSKLIGNEVIGATGKALAANAAKNLGTQIAVNAISKAPATIAVDALNKATQYRGISANSMQDLLGIVESSKNSVPTTYTGGQTYGNGAYFFNNPEDAKNWAVTHQPGEYKAVLAIDRPLGSYIDYGTYRKNRSDFISRLDAPGSQINQIADAAFNKYMDKNGVTGYVGNNYEGRNPVYVVKNPEAMKNLRVSSVYTPDTKDWAAVEGDLQNFVKQNNLEMYLGSPENQANSDMMTLYRGLSQEYDPNYPVARLDTSGYESWTDNPELAKQYGDYVYSIDVPKADIKSGYLDEDPNSPTYGDRNPIYSIDKKAGLNGVSGNEYLLEVGSDYQKGLKYNEYQPGIVKKYLGEPQSNTSDFSKSKIKDKRGNLLKLYHGTDADFREFGNVKTEPGYWFTEDKSYALSHGNNLKTVNLNMVNPLDVTTVDGDNKMWEYAKDCFGKENVSEDEIMSNKFRDYLIDKGYDGIIFDHSGKNTYIAFSPEQIKILDK